MAVETPTGTVNGTTGSDGNATFSATTTVANELLFVDRLLQVYGTDYTTSGSVITFLAPSIPITGSILRLYNGYTAPTITSAATYTEINSADQTATDILQAVKDRAQIPTGSTAYSDTAILGFINEELQASVHPFIVSLRQNYLLDYVDISLVASLATYDIPSRASSITEVTYVDGNSNEARPITQIAPEDEWRYFNTGGESPQVFVFSAAQIKLIPIPATSTGAVRVKYARRPAKLVLDTITSAQHTAVGTIASVSATTITLAAVHNGFPASTQIDITSNHHPFRLRARDITTTTAVAGTTTIAVATDLTAGQYGIRASDYVTPANRSYVLQAPLEATELLILMAARRILSMKRKWQARQEIEAAIKELKKDLTKLLSPRSTGNRKHANAWRS